MDSADAILVDISDALSERDKVKYTVHTRTRLPDLKPETSVVREHEEFLWLHGVLEENESYAGFIVSCSLSRFSWKPSYCRFPQLPQNRTLTPPVRNFRNWEKEKQLWRKKSSSRWSTTWNSQFLFWIPTNYKLICCRDYLAQFKKTVAMHEVFLQRIAAHPVFKNDQNFRIFLQYENEVRLLFDWVLAIFHSSSPCAARTRRNKWSRFGKDSRSRRTRCCSPDKKTLTSSSRKKRITWSSTTFTSRKPPPSRKSSSVPEKVSSLWSFYA